ncbi:MAG: IS110 family transposase [Gammaproteobacteria bacterium]
MDIAKGVFQAVLVQDRSQLVWSKRFRREQLLSRVAQLPKCLIVMEACASAHHWAREFDKLGHHVMLLPAHHVSPYRQGQKNDCTDAMAIVEASYRAQIKAVPMKSEEQQLLQSLYMIRRRLIAQRTSLSNQIRGLLGEFGVALPKGLSVVRRQLPALLEHLQPALRMMMHEQYEELCALDARIDRVSKQLESMCRAHPVSQALMKLPGIGPITASLLIAHCNAGAYRNGRSYSALLGLVPRQHSSGDRVRLYGITRTGNQELRMLLIHGGRAVVRRMEQHEDAISRFARGVSERRGKNKAAVAVANKLARQAWAEIKRAA